mgnify:CR=1 FL=1
MSTKATIRFAKREEGVSFDKHPEDWHMQAYRPSDGYIKGLGITLAKFLENEWPYGLSIELESADNVHTDVEYIYYIWTAKGKSTWISVFNGYGDNSTCVFVGTPRDLIEKYG